MCVCCSALRLTYTARAGRVREQDMLKSEGLRRLTTIAAALALGALVAVVVLWGAKPAEAAFPGANGMIAFASSRTTGEGVDNLTGDYEIFTMNKDGTGVTQLTNNTADDTSPSFSDDGSVVVFTSERDGNQEIYVMNSNGTDESRMTNNTVDDD